MGESVCLCREGLAGELPEGVSRSAGEGGPWELCALSPEGAAEMAERAVRCRTLLVPEGAYRPGWQAERVVSYGLDRRSSLTLSSVDGGGVVCLQRSLTDRLGRTVEQQELLLPARWRSLAPEERLLLAGVWLLRGGLPRL